MKTLVIVMSTYNGEKYLEDQLDSILNQNCQRFEAASFRVLIRDDGSCDRTQEILEWYAKDNPDKISWYQGKNIGVVNSFFELLERAGKADYYAFSDQDDYWMPEKMTKAVEVLEKMDASKPLLYCGRPKLVDSQLRGIDSEIKTPPVRPAFENALIENVCPGCTEVFNTTMRDMIVKENPNFTVMHDWWLYLLASCFGEVYYDEESFLCYRQHFDNVVGTKTNYMDEMKMRIQRFRSTRGNLSRQAEELVRLYGREFPNHSRILLAREFIEAKKSFWARRKLLKKSGIFRQRKMDNRIFHWILLTGSY